MGQRNSKCPGFVDNWSYIKTELQWLDRLLLLAVGRQRRDRRETDKVSRSQRDRLTRHWWKGIVNLESTPRYDDGRPPTPSAEFAPEPKSTGQSGQSVPRATASAEKKQAGYQKQLEARIGASHAEGVHLALPALRDRLQLTLFEKNLIILGLAPEVNRRYARLYAYLQDTETSPLPQVDLALKLLCRNDQEWYTARRRLVEDSPLVQSGLISLVSPEEQPLLTHRVKLSAPLVNYLLANPMEAASLDELLGGDGAMTDEPMWGGTVLTDGGTNRAGMNRAGMNRAGMNRAGMNRAGMNRVMGSAPGAGSMASARWQPTVGGPMPQPQVIPPRSGDAWAALILPRSLKRELKHLSQRLQLLAFDPPEYLAAPLGSWAILAGPCGTGKAMAAMAMAHGAQTNLMRMDLNQYGTAQLIPALQGVQEQAPTVLLIESAERMLGGQPEVDPRWVEQFLAQRQQQPCLTVMSVTLQAKVAPGWLQRCDRLLLFGLPDLAERTRLWKRAFPKEVTVDSRVSWTKLAEQGRLTGGQIQAIARDAALYAQIEAKPRVMMSHIQRAWKQRQSARL